ncbi:hypothetical protein AB205_0093330 [Aquarana catesbeiana]|uniref:Uncharacterized protein n=1 Tax=Aquarana catesbeiana TaxID=8400 RepID=A0A2G9QKK5_AQUCT|nr:hypothetical protein AB205_0093330 [Aquarana catesbeiana]
MCGMLLAVWMWPYRNPAFLLESQTHPLAWCSLRWGRHP